MALGTLTIDLAANVARLESDLGKAARISAKHAEDMQRRWARAGRIIGAAITAAATGAFASWIKGSIDASDAAMKMARSVGVSVEALTGLQHAAELSGISHDQLGQSLGRLNRAMSEAAAGSQRQASVFADMGLSVKDAAGNLKSADAMLLEIADKFAGYADGAAKAALAQDLFGRSGAQMIKLLNNGSDGIKALTDQARALGLVIDQETAMAAERFNDQLTVLQRVGDGAANTIARELTPVLSEMAGLLIDLANDSEGAAMAAEVLGNVLKGVATIGIAVASTFANVGRAIGGMAAAANAAARGEFSQAAAIVRQFSEDNARATAQAEERMRKLWSGEFRQAGEQAAAVQRALGEQITRTSRAADGGARATRAQTDSIQQQIAALQLQAQTIGMTTSQATLYKLALDGATDAQMAMAAEALRTVDAFREQEAAMRATAELAQAVADVQASTWTDASRALAVYQRQVETLRAGVLGGLISDEDAARTIELLDAQLLAVEEKTDQMSQFAQRAAQNMQDAFADFLFDPFASGVDGMLDGFVTMLRQMISQAIAADVFAALGMGGSGGNVAGLASGIFGLFGGGRAVGGPAQAGKLYEVGENNAPELFVSGGRQYMIPGNSGSVIPASGGGGVTQVFNIVAPDPNAFRVSARQIARRAREANAIL